MTHDRPSSSPTTRSGGSALPAERMGIGSTSPSLLSGCEAHVARITTLPSGGWTTAKRFNPWTCPIVPHGEPQFTQPLLAPYLSRRR